MIPIYWWRDSCLCPQQMQLQSSAELEMAEVAVGVLTVSSLHKFNLVFLALRDCSEIDSAANDKQYYGSV